MRSDLQEKRILAIDPGTRHLGVAVMESGNLVHHAVKVIPKGLLPHQTLRNGREVVMRLFTDFRPTVLVIEKTFFARNRNVALLNVFADDIIAYAKRRKCQVLCFDPGTVKREICGNGRAGKSDVAKMVVAHYPELKAYLSQNRKWKDRFQSNMFDAVALGLMVR